MAPIQDTEAQKRCDCLWCRRREIKSKHVMYHIPKRNIIRGGCKYDAASLKTSGVGNEDIQAETRMPEDFIGAVRRNTNSGH